MPRVGKYDIFPFPPGSLQQREGGGHYRFLKKTYVGAGMRMRVPGRRTGGQVLRLLCWEKKMLFDVLLMTAEETDDMQLAFGVPSLSLAAPRLSQHHK